MSGAFDDFPSRCASDCVRGSTSGCEHSLGPDPCDDCQRLDAEDEAQATSEPEHVHVCPACGDSWRHADVDCEVVYPARTWALCPIHRERDDE